MKLRADQMLDTRDTLVAGGPGTSTLVSCNHREASHLRAFLYRNGIEVEVIKRAPGTYRFIRKETAHA